MSEIRVDGLEELRDLLLRKLPERIRTKALQPALARAAKPILDDAKARVPVKTGRIRKAIYSYKPKSSTKERAVRNIAVRAGRRHGSRDAYYWKFVEFGRGEVVVGRKRGERIRGARAASLGNVAKGWFGKSVKAVPARPFMRPAFESKKLEAIERFKQFMGPEIEKAAEKYSQGTTRRLRRKALGI